MPPSRPASPDTERGICYYRHVLLVATKPSVTTVMHAPVRSASPETGRGIYSYQHACLKPSKNPRADGAARPANKAFGTVEIPPICKRGVLPQDTPLPLATKREIRRGFAQSDFPCTLSSVCKGNQPLRKPLYSSLLVAAGCTYPPTAPHHKNNSHWLFWGVRRRLSCRPGCSRLCTIQG